VNDRSHLANDWITDISISDEAGMLLQIGSGGYVVGRAEEKIIPVLFNKKLKGME
jgi:hypothetical protein